MTATSSSDVVLDISDLAIEVINDDQRSVIVNGVSVTIKRGEVLGLVGESGAGKSTIGLAALGYTRPGAHVTKGSASLKGCDLFSLREAERRNYRGTDVAYVAQSAQAAFNPAHRLMDQIVLVATRRGGLSRADAEQRAVTLFTTLKLPDPQKFGQRYPHQVSGGQLQRAMVAMAMICNPSLIVFDEPTTALDVTTQVEVLISIREVIEKFGVAALYITHDLAVVAQLAHRVAVLRYGSVVEEASIEEIMLRPQHPYTKSLWSLHDMPRELSASGATGDQPLLSVAGLHAHYGAVEVLKDININVAKGQTVALVGESGSGKSTLGRVIVGLKDPSEGTLTYDGNALGARISQRPKSVLNRIQIIYQSADTALNPRQTIRKIIGRPLTLYHGLRGSQRNSRTVELLRMVELNETHLDRYPGQLSGGQKQRVAIARALAADPELIVCDEITSALDKVVQAEVLRMLKDLQRRLGLSLIFITHDIEVVRAIADRVVVLQHGKIVEQGTNDEIFSPPHQPYTETLLSSVPDLALGWLDAVIAARAGVAV